MAIGCAISTLCVGLLALCVDWDDVVTTFREATILPLVVATILVVLCYLVFSLRWRMLLTRNSVLPLGAIFSYLMTGYAANLLFPLRPGDILRAVLVHRAFDYGMVRALGSVALERLLDLLCLVTSGLAIITMTDVPVVFAEALKSVGLVVLVIGMGIAFVVWFAKCLPMQRLARQVLLGAFQEVVSRAMADFSESFKDLVANSPSARRQLLSVVGLSGLGWGLFAGAMVACLVAFRPETPLGAGVALMVVTNLGSAIPASPAGVGVYHALAVMVLAIWDIPASEALAIATASHVLVVGTQIGLAMGSHTTRSFGKEKHSIAARKGIWDRR